MAGLPVAEILGLTLGQMLSNAVYVYAARFGLILPLPNDPNAQALLTTVAKVFACILVTGLALMRSGESWRSLGRGTLRPIATSLAFVLIVGGIVIFLSELDNVLRAFASEESVDRLNWAPPMDFLFDAKLIGPLLLVFFGPLTEEIVFRGLLLRGLLGRYRPWTAIIVSAVFF